MKSDSNIDITIIIATYNAAETFEKCLLSFTSQLTKKCELIIVDGASTDNTLSIAKKFETKIATLISEKDNGIYDAWNKGIKKARGNWLMFIGADDILFPNSISVYLNLLDTVDLAKYDYISANNEYVDKDGKLLKILGKQASWKMMRKNMEAAHVGSLHNRKNLFMEVGVYNLEYKICADYELLLRKRDKLKSYFLCEKIAQMKVGGMSFSLKAIYETFKIRKKHKTVPKAQNYFLLFRDILGFEFFKLRKTLCANI